MKILTTLFDLALCGGLLWLAWRTVTIPRLVHSVILFMVFGFLMAVTWARLGAADLALAEAAIGAGVMGALMLNACRAAQVDATAESGGGRNVVPGHLPRPLAAAVCAALGVLLATAMAWLTAAPAPSFPALYDALANHPLENPVSAVLLDLRGYDTLLEMVVLLAALLGTRALAAQRPLPFLHPDPAASSPMVDALTTMVTPILLTMALYVYWAGGDAPGGAFQAGALLGALGVMYLLTGRLAPREHALLPMRVALVAGLGVFTVFACLGLAWRGLPLAYPRTATDAWVMLLEFGMTVSIAVTLTLLLSATPGVGIGRRS